VNRCSRARRSSGGLRLPWVLGSTKT
jgi:hypothetical protein